MPISCGLPKKGPLACLVVLVLALSAAVGTTSAGAAPAAQRDLGGDYVALVNSLSQIASHDRSNCVKMAADLKSYIAAHHAEIASLKARSQKLTKAQKLAFGREYGAKLAAAVRTFTQNVLACVTSAEVQAALATVKGINP